MAANNTLETIQIYYKIRYYTEIVEDLVRFKEGTYGISNQESI